MAHKTLIDGTAHETTGGRILVGGTVYSISKGRTLVGGADYDIPFSFPAGELPVGSSVFFDVNGKSTEFLVVHQGNPDSTMYAESCDGTWLLMKDLYVNMEWAIFSNSYYSSMIHSYLNGDFIGLLDSGIQSAIKQVKIPYVDGTGSGGTVRKKNAGLYTKIFLLSGYEVGWTTKNSSYMPVDGACLDYFIGTSAIDSKRTAYRNGTARAWWLRSPHTDDTTMVFTVSASGAGYSGGTNCNYNTTSNSNVRPAFILDSSTPIAQAGGKYSIE